MYGNSFYVFAGFDGTSRVNDFHEYSFDTHQWAPVGLLSGVAPSPRHSHAAVVHITSMYVFGGYDGSYRSGALSARARIGGHASGRARRLGLIARALRRRFS